jgi:hypothetical protein
MSSPSDARVSPRRLEPMGHYFAHGNRDRSACTTDTAMLCLLWHRAYMNPLDCILQFRSALPAVREWIEKTIEDNKAQAVPVISFAYRRLEKVFPGDLLGKAKAVVVDGKVPFPQLSRMGLPANVMERIQSETDTIWRDVVAVLE